MKLLWRFTPDNPTLVVIDRPEVTEAAVRYARTSLRISAADAKNLSEVVAYLWNHPCKHLITLNFIANMMLASGFTLCPETTLPAQVLEDRYFSETITRLCTSPFQVESCNNGWARGWGELDEVNVVLTFYPAPWFNSLRALASVREDCTPPTAADDRGQTMFAVVRFPKGERRPPPTVFVHYTARVELEKK